MVKEQTATKKKSVKERIVEISNELVVVRRGKNKFQEFDYFEPDDILKALTPLLQKHRLIADFNMPFNKEKELYEGSLTVEDMDSEEARLYHFDIPLTQVKGAGQAQNAGATMTYCKRYMIMNTFNIADNAVDPDNSKNKPLNAKGEEHKKVDIEGTIKSIRHTNDKDKLVKWRGQAQSSKIYTDAQKNVLIRAIDDQLATIK